MEHLEVAPLNRLAPILLFGLVGWVLGLAKIFHAGQAPARSKAARPLKPKTGGDCPLCQAGQGGEVVNEGAPRVVPQPWREGRSRRGRKKASVTEGYACDNPHCKYYGITNETIHALVADGSHGKYERIQDLVCQACGSKFMVRRPTVLYRLKTRSGRVAEALTFLAEGVDVSVLERVWGIAEGTLRTWLTRAGLHAEKLHEHFFQSLSFRQIPLDELWANAR